MNPYDLCSQVYVFACAATSVLLWTDLHIVNEEKLLRAVSHQEGEQIQLLAAVLRENLRSLGNLTEELQDYEEYVEGWAMCTASFRRILRRCSTMPG